MQYILFFSTNYWRWRKSKIASLNLIFLCAINVIVTFFRIVLNSVVIQTLWKVSLLRKKLCYFIMVMVLSCIDLLNDVITNCPTLTIYSMIRINEGYDVCYSCCMIFAWTYLIIFLRFHLSQSQICDPEYCNWSISGSNAYPIFHKTSVTKRKLLTVLAISFVLETVFDLISFLISHHLSR
jgi:hypothetical protein